MVLGADGVLGAELARRALPRFFFRVIGLERARCDFTRGDHVVAALDTFRPNVVLLAGGFEDLARAELKQGRAFRVNALAAEELARACRVRRVRVVYFSSDRVFEGAGPGPFRESSRPNPVSRYAWSKADGETAVLSVTPKDNLVIRVSGLHGADLSSFVGWVLARAMAHQEIVVPAAAAGALTWVEPLARLVAWATSQKLHGVLHLVPPDHGTVAELARGVLDAFGVRGEVREADLGVLDSLEVPGMPWARLVSSRADELQGYQLPGWRELLARFAEARGPDLRGRLKASGWDGQG